MAHLRKTMLEELQRRNYSDSTIRHYLGFVERFAHHFDKSPDKLGPDHMRIRVFSSQVAGSGQVVVFRPDPISGG